ALGNGHILTHVRKTVGPGASDVIQRSTDFGATFQDLQSWPVAQSAGIVSTWLYNTTDHCLVVRNPAGGGGWEVFQYKNSTFSRLATTTATGTPVTLTGTLHEGIKVYATTATEGGYYSEDGTTWVRRATLKPRLETVHPTQPNLLFANEPQHDISTDGGLTWRIYPDNDRTVGWDPKHLTYYKVDGKWVFVAANDMGLCFNPEPLDTAAGAWRYVNDNHTFGILHGGVAVDHTGLTVTANQDPGTFELTPTGRGVFSAQNKNGADGLRVAASNDGKAYWYKHYWDSFMHNHAASTGDTRKAYFDIPKTNWYTPAFKGSTTPGEDAIYVSGQAKLVKLTYNTSDNTVTRLDLPYDFQASAGEVTFGVGVAKSDPSRLYVATRNGRFFHSRDAGATWTETSYTGPKPAPSSYPVWNQSAGLYIEVADTDPNLVYWGAAGNAVACLISRDGGRTFQAAQNGLPADARIGALSLSPDGNLAFSSTFHVYIASKNAWYDLRAASMPSGALPAATGLNYLPLQRKVRYFTWGAGVLDLDITHLSTPDQPAVSLSTSACYQLAEAGTGLVLGTNTSGALD
ncbi:MAG TPA: hypothetical protein VK465_16045, partial [Fibrobacteria bacterium]|nr:hypothetical protein [Fibrobacteria bacterium]